MKKIIALKIGNLFTYWFRLRYGKRISFGKNTILNGRFAFRGKGRLVIGDDVNMWAHKEKNEFITLDEDAVIEIGDRCRLNGISIQCKKRVSVGNDCLIGSAMILDTDYHSIHFEKRNDPQFIKVSPVAIKNRVWLAGQSAILKGVTVHDDAVVGFRAVVAKDVPAQTVVAGNPAREITHIDPL
jgi:acetyltransferase-like isoleucine patch superfamily enzyme